jgi:predicted nucleic acid-binding protein
VRYAFDSSSIINLFNAGALPLASSVARCEICLPPLVVAECEPSCAAVLLDLKQQGVLTFMTDADVDGDLFLQFLSDHGLGAGETECLAVASTHEVNICCDDRKARDVAAAMLGPGRVIGTLRLLRWMVEDELVICEEAYSLFSKMRSCGGFLPPTEKSFFCGSA